MRSRKQIKEQKDDRKTEKRDQNMIRTKANERKEERKVRGFGGGEVTKLKESEEQSSDG